MIRLNSFNYGSIFGHGSSGNSIWSNLAQLNSVRSGSYAKALKAYYGKAATDNTSQRANQSNRLNTFNYGKEAALSDVRSEASELISSANKLTNSGKDSLFKSEEKYDADAAYKAVSDFVGDYNDTVSALAKTDNITVKSAGTSMTRMTDIMKNSLSKAGISVASDGKLSINEEDFKKADMNTVKSIFGDNSSYARIVSSSAQRVQTAVNNQQSVYGSGIYGKTGSNYNDLYSGLGFNGFF